MRNEFQPLDAVVINAGVRHECEPTDDILIWRDDGRAETLYEAGSDEEFERPPLEFRALSLLRVACRSIYVGALVLESLLFTLLGLPWVLVVAVLTSGLYPRETFNLVRVVWHFCVTRVGDRGRNLIDYRRPILLLRAHDDDNVMVDDTIDTNPFGLRTPGEFQRERVVPSESPFEEVIAKALTRFGPLVALRTKKQKERRFQFRKYLVHYNDWQRQILHWIDNSQLIVVLIGTEQSMSDPRWGLGWEISTLIKMNSFHKVMQRVLSRSAC